MYKKLYLRKIKDQLIDKCFKEYIRRRKSKIKFYEKIIYTKRLHYK